jgi:hypothetical protein
VSSPSDAENQPSPARTLKGTSERAGLRLRTAALALVCAATCTAAAAVPAAAASSPGATTGAAKAVSYSGAILTGTVSPHGHQTYYYFQYGVTRAYGSQTALTSAGSGTAPLAVSVPVTGLSPLTQYHYRLVAAGAAGVVAEGSDHTFVTTAVPLSLQILAAPNPVPFGGTVVVQGTLSGTGNASREVILQADPFGSPAGFQQVGNPELTTATGSFSFPVLGLASTTAFRVVTAMQPQVSSPVATALVAAVVDAHIGRSRKPGRLRVYGTVTPAENGMRVGILREVRGRGILVGGAILAPDGPSRSAFSRTIPSRPGVYRVLVVVTGGAQISAYGRPLLVR